MLFSMAISRQCYSPPLIVNPNLPSNDEIANYVYLLEVVYDAIRNFK